MTIILKKSILLADNLAYKLSLERTLFQEIQVSIGMGDRIALVGKNGVGKSTLLKILAGQIYLTKGTVWQNGVIYYLPQISTIKQELTFHGIWKTPLPFLSPTRRSHCAIVLCRQPRMWR